MLWDVFYVPEMGPQPAAQMCMESAARQSKFSLQLASQLDQADCLIIKTLDFQFRCSFQTSLYAKTAYWPLILTRTPNGRCKADRQADQPCPYACSQQPFGLEMHVGTLCLVGWTVFLEVHAPCLIKVTLAES